MRAVSKSHILSFALTLSLCSSSMAQFVGQIESMKLLTPEVGWAATKHTLFWTADAGAHWKEITPNTKRGYLITSVFFLDVTHGWVLLAHAGAEDPKTGTADTLFDLATTDNAGENWSLRTLAVPDPDPSRGLSGDAWLDFIDPMHGWILVRMNSNTSLSMGVLRSTEDGGKTWKSVSVPVAGPVHFVSQKDGWLTGGPTESEIRALFVTHDAGKNWQEQKLPPPATTQAATYPTFDLPTFQDERHGFLPVTYSGPDGTKSALVLFATDDGGQKWHSDRALAGLPETSQGTVLPSAVLGSSWLAVSVSGRAITTTIAEKGPSSGFGHDRTVRAEVENGTAVPAIRQLDFAEGGHGWLLLFNGDLLSTPSGGAAWENVTPARAVQKPPQGKPLSSTPARRKETRLVTRDVTASSSPDVSTHLGFDRFPVIPSADMQAWVRSSPYYDVGIYLPGSQNKSNDSKLTPAWVSTVQGQQGWGIIPIWFGLQSSCACRTLNPCVPFTYKISTTTTQARSQGTSEASAAIAAAQALGLSPTIIYKDIENYYISGTGACTSSQQATAALAVQAFVGGWDQQMQTAGKAGVYGNPAPAAQDFSKASPAPDAGWIAKYPAQGSPPQLTIWALGTLTDSPNWTNSQRIHQFQQNLSQAWGNATSYNIDPDIDNAPVVNANSGAKIPSSYTYRQFNYPGALNTSAYGINDIWDGAFINGAGLVGQIVGTYQDSSGLTHGFLLDGFVAWTPIDYPGAQWTDALGINNSSQIVGTYFDSSGQHGFLLSGGSLTSIDYPGAVGATQVWAINDAGQIAGTYEDSAAVWHGFLYYAGLFYPINYPGGGNTFGQGINGDGTIAGWFQAPGANGQGFAYYPTPPSWTGTFLTITYAGATATFMGGANNDNEITGYYIGGSTYYGLTLSNGVLFTTFQYPASTNTLMFSTNDFGQSVGYYYTSTNFFGFVAIAQP